MNYRSKPIFYDPEDLLIEEKNTAPRGSLLKIWEGKIEFGKYETFGCELHSTKDIKLYQFL